ncbi:MAG: hypothetical protein SFX73_04300 [Kofleriaceae bacterium]|nr:hypothetical protein [Kofleriaceae bacterium]
MERPTSTLASTIVFGVAFALFALCTPSVGWDVAAGHAALAAQHDHLAAAPLFGALAAAAADLPVGEVGFRVNLMSALLGALTLAGVVKAARAWLPRDPVAGVIGAVLLALAPPFREAVGFASPSILAACGVVWMLAMALDKRALPALAWAGVVVGSSPWLGLVLVVVALVWFAKTGVNRSSLALAVAALGVLAIALWATAIGRFPSPALRFSTVIASSAQGAAAIVVGSGLLGIAFGAATGLPSARWVAIVLLATLVGASAGDPSPAPLLAVFAIGIAVIPSAIVRAIARAVDARRRELVVGGAGVPLVLMALLVGPALGVDDPRGAPSRLANDLIGSLPPGPGAIVLTRTTPWSAVNYEQAVAGARPDLVLAPMMPPEVADGVVVRHLREKNIIGSDKPALGRLDPSRAVPRGRGFQLQLDQATIAVPPPPPATYASTIGERQAVTLALTRARYEANAGRLDAAARAAGLTSRFRAADLAMLATSAPSPTRPPLYGFVPHFPEEPIRVSLELFGDDLAWVAGLEQPAVDTPRSRKLHALWREVLLGIRKADDPEIIALGPDAVAATAELTTALLKRP